MSKDTSDANVNSDALTSYGTPGIIPEPRHIARRGWLLWQHRLSLVNQIDRQSNTTRLADAGAE